jgi:hypothetical protein
MFAALLWKVSEVIDETRSGLIPLLGVSEVLSILDIAELDIAD